MYKNILYIAILVFTFSSCGTDKTKLFSIDMEAEFTMPANVNTIETFYYEIPNVPTNFEVFSGNLNEESIGSINSYTCTLEGIFDPINYNFIQEIYILGVDPSNSAVQHELFYRDFNPVENEVDLELFANLANQKEILKNELIHLVVRVRYRSNIGTELTHRISLRFDAFEEE